MTSADLSQCQETLENLAKLEIDKPMTDHIKLNRLLKVILLVDKTRRIAWNEEKFGYADDYANEVFNKVSPLITTDDVPF